MTETVTLALQGRVVQLGEGYASPFDAPLFRLSDDEVHLSQGSRSVTLDPYAIADLRDILNALKERESKPLDPTRTPRPRCCRECDYLSIAEGECMNPVVKGRYRLHVFAFDVTPDWCPLPKADGGEREDAK